MDLVATITCPRCGQDKPADSRNPHICEDCAKAENSRVSYLRQHQEDWIEAAKEAGVDTWLQQPGETQWEYTVWQAYRDAYPGKKPTYGDVARQLNTTVGAVHKIAQRWTFPARLQLWIAECDRLTIAQRHQEILSMNAEHIDMASRLRSKMSLAIDCVDPTTLKPSELATLLKVATELERKARLDVMETEDLRRGSMSIESENPNLKKSPTKQGDLGEVVKILLNAGALGSVTQIGVRETTTREFVARDDSGNETYVVDKED